MSAFFLLLLIGAFVCFAIAAFGSRFTGRVNFVALGLLFWVLVPLIQNMLSLGK